MTWPGGAGAQFPQVTPVPGSRLEQLAGMLSQARAAAREAADRAKAIEDGIKAEVTAACPGQPVIGITGGPGRPALQLSYHPGGWFVPAAALLEKHPAAWDELKTQRRGSWQLREADGDTG